eukprot:CAMPEP_0117423338 /NCGR_PEP_ID=MMETSP0758-20121206/3986_1 /TAXON_ID=63605 /ORGANISM="Percolomonas cosmopolitus, Strain AE-1 (ATCC 50343)" /LENGTH=879 /DNA_ID=CAMNT_0005206475 /DNA_START=523 /DNA_END=3162 /DNA_ORIENTATION=+
MNHSKNHPLQLKKACDKIKLIPAITTQIDMILENCFPIDDLNALKTIYNILTNLDYKKRDIQEVVSRSSFLVRVLLESIIQEEQVSDKQMIERRDFCLQFILWATQWDKIASYFLACSGLPILMAIVQQEDPCSDVVFFSLDIIWKLVDLQNFPDIVGQYSKIEHEQMIDHWTDGVMKGDVDTQPESSDDEEESIDEEEETNEEEEEEHGLEPAAVVEAAEDSNPNIPPLDKISATRPLTEKQETDFSAFVEILSNTFKVLIEQGIRLRDKQTRNDTLVLLLHILCLAPIRPQARHHILPILIDILQIEMDDQSTSIFSNENVDFEFFLLILDLLYLLSFDQDCQNDLLNAGYIGMMLNYIDITCRPLAFVAKWRIDQIDDIQRKILKTLNYYTKTAKDMFVDSSAVETIYECLREAFEEGSDVTDELIISLNFAISFKEGAQIYFQQPQALDFLIGIILPNDNMELPMHFKHAGAEMLTSLVTHVPTIVEQLEENNIVPILLDILILDGHLHGEDREAQHCFLCRIILFLWEYASYSMEARVKFLQYAGIDRVLDLFDDGIEPLKYVILGFITDYCNWGKEEDSPISWEQIMEQIMDWRSEHNSRTAAQVLLTVWTQKKDKFAALKNTEAKTEFVIPDGPITLSTFRATTSMEKPAVDVEDDIFSSLFGISKEKIDFKEKLYHAFKSMEFFKGVQMEKLMKKLNERQAFSLVCEYHNILEDRVWQHMEDQLEQEQIRPTTPDEEVLSMKTQGALERNQSLTHRKQQLNQMQHQQAEKEQENFYQTIIKVAETQKEDVLSGTRQLPSITELKRQKKKMLKQAHIENELAISSNRLSSQSNRSLRSSQSNVSASPRYQRHKAQFSPYSPSNLSTNSLSVL